MFIKTVPCRDCVMTDSTCHKIKQPHVTGFISDVTGFISDVTGFISCQSPQVVLDFLEGLKVPQLFPGLTLLNSPLFYCPFHQ